VRGGRSAGGAGEPGAVGGDPGVEGGLVGDVDPVSDELIKDQLGRAAGVLVVVGVGEQVAVLGDCGERRRDRGIG